jgi:hypothetical protein
VQVLAHRVFVRRVERTVEQLERAVGHVVARGAGTR